MAVQFRFSAFSAGAVTLVITTFCSVHPASAESLRSAVEETLASHPELGAIRANRHAIDHELTAARGLRLPTLDVQGKTGRHKGWSTNQLGIRTGDNWHRHSEVSGTLSQRLFDGFEARHEIARQRNRVQSARWRVNDTANSIALRVIQAYLEVQRARAVLASARGNVAKHERILSRVRYRVSGGRGTSSDRSEALSRTANARALKIEAVARLRDAEALYRSLVGHGPRRLQAVKIPYRAMPKSVSAAVDVAVRLAPSVVATEYDTTAAKAAIGTAYSRFFPKLNAELTGERNWGDTHGSDRSYDMKALLVVRWSLFNGGIDKARKWEARARALEAEEISENTRRVVERETRTSWNAIQSSRARVPQLRTQLRQARLTRAAYSRQYDAGRRRLLDLLDIQAEVFSAEASLRNESFIGIYSSYRVLAAMGQLIEALGLDLPEEAANPPTRNIIEGWRDGWQNWTATVSYHESFLRRRGVSVK